MAKFDQASDAQLARLLAEIERAGNGSDELTRLVHDLQVHQIELEQQNRELLAVRAVLEESRERYADLYDFAPVGYLSIDAAGRIQDINLTGAKLLGQSRNALINRAFSGFLRPEDRARLNGHIAEILYAREPGNCEVRLRARDSADSVDAAEPRTLMLESRLEDGSPPARIRMILSDITERKQAERERRQREIAAAAAESRHRLVSGLERLSAAATTAFDPQTVLNDLLRVVQDLLRVDRAWLLYPCDPDATEVRILAQSAVPRCPGEPLTDRSIPTDEPLRRLIRSALNACDPVQDPDPGAIAILGGGFAPRSRLIIAVRPEDDRPSLLGLHLCRVERTWSEDDLTLARALAGRLADILDILAVRRALTESEERFRATFEQAAVGICHLDRQGFFLRVNRKLCAILGYTAEELLARTCRGLVHPDDHDDLMEYIARIGEDRARDPEREPGTSQSLELRHLGKAGHVIWCNLTMAAVRDSSGGLRYFIGVIEDISARKRLEERESRHRHALFRFGRISTMGEMSSAIAHEVAQPLMGISTYAGGALERLDNAPVDVEALRLALHQISRLAARAGRIIERIRDFSRQHAGAPRPIDMEAVSRAAVGMIEPEIRANDVKVEIRSNDDVPLASGDPVEIEQVLINLLMNGMDAMRDTPPAERRLRIAIKRAGADQVRVAVGDRGVGLDQTDPSRLFDPFYTTKEGGTGLGLSMSRTIVDSYGGRIWAEPRPGGGAVFAFTLPRHLPAEASDRSSAKTPASSTDRRLADPPDAATGDPT
ncbi:PAS domain S-box protein [Thiocapsa marina]|uniref:histidine kinase n=1 Tax=Thiocapsa marina 5811 TaxID=768671 RepID=F9U5D8_9GAMM|nr:PAS domain S-box protein [Thiocapsa marina]EGV20361.1 multi-sensor signal transduction histidine kinase [Thiocapsa marina 5811]